MFAIYRTPILIASFFPSVSCSFPLLKQRYTDYVHFDGYQNLKEEFYWFTIGKEARSTRIGELKIKKKRSITYQSHENSFSIFRFSFVKLYRITESFHRLMTSLTIAFQNYCSLSRSFTNSK